ncbi:DNA-directed RNA polymerase subunit beta [Mycoplasmoides alvi]|nr:DNA-directed RNA polymerase subunit beta [Mycoplasmoides alvi]
MHEYSPKVIRRDYTKVQSNFVPPNLPSLQVNAYKKFLEVELEKIISSFFPIVSPNGKFSVEFSGISFSSPELTEKQARIESKSYEASLYADLMLIDRETGTVKKKSSKKSKSKSKDVSEEGVFFAKIPLMTEKGTFLVNGIDKFVIAQIARSPGAYILGKSQVKLSNSRKRNQEGYVCEILPAKGTFMLVYIAENKNFVQAVIRDVSGESAKVFSITTILKAFGLTHSEILRIFNNDEYIVRTLESENYNAKYIFRDNEILSILKEFSLEKEDIKTSRGLPIDLYLKELVHEYYLKNKDLEEFIETNRINVSKIKAEYLSEYNKKKEDIDTLIERIICERAAKNVVHELSISVKTLDTSNKNSWKPSYQLLLWQHFFQKRHYDLSLPGRYKFVRKLRISERLYQRTLSEDLFDINNNLVFSKGTLILKPEIDKIKTLSKEKKLKTIKTLSIVNPEINQGSIKQETNYEIISVFTNNELRENVTPIIGIDGSDNTVETLTLIDLLSVISYIINLPHNVGNYDDIDHLGNKRLKLINELLYGRVQTGMARMERYIREKLAIADGSNKNVEINEETGELVETDKQKTRLTIKSVVNSKPFQIVIRDFFNTHQLTQFLDQQNPLSELTNKRRISAMGPGGISREDPNLDIRDVHYSHYGRICPIETPEGMNIGLIMSLAFYATIDSNGFLMSPYRKVKNGKITDEVEYLTALREDEYIIAESSASMKIHADGLINEKEVIARYRSSQELYEPKRIDYIDVAPRQVVSIAASLIPFLENDDSARALMGANMQRQATPLLKPYAPTVGTGVEYKIAHDSGMAIIANNDGKIVNVSNDKVVVQNNDGKLQTYALTKFEKSNQNTCYNHSPIVSINQNIKAGEVLADGPSMKNGELALGQNVLVAFTTWRGYNYEDAIIVSERLFREDVYTSITINEYTVQCVRTRNGDEEITRDIPNVSESAKRYLDEDGIIMVGAEVKEGDILVGKISPKGQVDLSAEEKLLQAIFGEKTKNIRESSLKVPNGGEGTVAAVRRFNIAKNDELDDDVIELVKVYIAQKRKIQIGDKVAGRHGNKGIVSKIVPIEDMPHLEDGTPVDIMLNPLGVPSRMNIGQIFEIHLGLAARELAKKELIESVFVPNGDKYISDLFGLNLPIAKSLINTFKTNLKERKITNLEDAKKQVKTIDIDITLRQMGLSYDDLAYKIATPVFEGVNMGDLKEIMKEANIDTSKNFGKFKLIDGRTGEPFEKPITIGVMYMLKLHHMVDDKIHSRAVGPYSKITQQPLGGKSQNGGQRFGEMEVWALQAYGAAHNLRELLTIKSDDVRGRNQTYNAIIKGKEIPTPGIPESFKLLTKELQGLGLAVNIIYDDNTKDDINSYTVVNDIDEDEEDEVFNRSMTDSFTLDDQDDKY